MADFYQRVDRIEARLTAIEKQLGLSAFAEHAEPAAAIDDTATAASPPAPPAPLRRLQASTATLMALGAAASFILAAAYFIMLAYDAGWLTPLRQVVAAFGAGCVLIGGGVWLAGRDRDYAAYLPAAGITVLYFAVYAGHVVYALVPVAIAITLIAAVSAGALALSWRFEQSVFALLAAVGVYLTPLLLRVEFTDLVVTVIYFSIWSLLFSFVALHEGRRATYLVALYLAMTTFDASWRLGGSSQWLIAAMYHFAQFAIFASTAALFAIRHRTTMGPGGALLHGIPLFYFYGLEYFILKAHAPLLVAPVALGSVGTIIAVFLFARRRLHDRDALAASATLVSAYCAFVSAHILFFELLPGDYFVWGAMLLPAIVIAAQRQLAWSNAVTVPLACVGGVLFACGFVVALLGLDDLPPVRFANAALLLYAVALYAVYAFVRTKPALRQLAVTTLYIGHLAILVLTVRAVDSGLAISIGWAVYAVALLTLALTTQARDLGQSSLVLFSASAFKVLVFDLDGSAPGLRIVTLIVLGGSLYLGGWLYQNLVRETTPLHADAAVDAALRMIDDLARRGFDDHRIAAVLARRGFRCPAATGWNEDLVVTLRRQHGLEAGAAGQ